MSVQPDEDAVFSARTWLEYAGNDLEMAVRGLQLPALAELVCYHSQQAAGKARKAYLVWLSEERVPRPHRLGDLAARIVRLGGASAPRDPLAILESYAANVRYPEAPWPSLPEAHAALEFAREVLAWVQQALALP